MTTRLILPSLRRRYPPLRRRRRGNVVKFAAGVVPTPGLDELPLLSRKAGAD